MKNRDVACSLTEYQIRRRMWSVYTIKTCFKSNTGFDACTKYSKKLKVFKRHVGHSYRGVIYAKSSSRDMYNIFHEYTGVLLLGNIKGKKHTKVICTILSDIFNWEQEEANIVFHSELKNIRKFLVRTREDSNWIYKTSRYDYLLNHYEY